MVRVDDVLLGLQTLWQQNEAACTQLKGAVEKYLDQNGRRWVQMSKLFSFMKV